MVRTNVRAPDIKTNKAPDKLTVYSYCTELDIGEYIVPELAGYQGM